MKLITLNIWGGKLMRNAFQYLSREQPDIINLQEVFMNGSKGFFDNLEELQEELHYPYKHFQPTLSFSFSSLKPSFGLLILSKYPIISTDVLFTNLSLNDNFDFAKDDINIRALQYAQIDIHGLILHDFNYHGYWIPGSKVGNEATVKHSKQILEYMEKVNGSKILTGDFNLLGECGSIELINQKYINLTMKYNIQTTRNNFSKNANQAIDFIFINDQIKEKSFHGGKDIISDHQPLIVEF